MHGADVIVRPDRGRGRFIRLAVAASGMAGVVLLTAASLRPDRTAGPCALTSDPALLHEIPESSGLAVSRRTSGIIWSHNDSGHESVLFAFDSSGSVRGRVRVPIRTRDWEDVSAGRCPSGSCLFIADIGDNGFARRRIIIARIPEPAPGDPVTAAPEVFNATYDDGRHNAEAMFVVGNDLFIVTKDHSGTVYRSGPASATNEASNEIVFTQVGQLGLEAVTDAEASPDEKTVVVRTSHEAVLYRATDVVGGKAEPFARVPLDGLKEPQGEGVALGAKGLLYLSSEGRPWNRAGRLLTLRCDVQ